MEPNNVPQDQSRIVLNIAGNDQPGITARLTQILADEGAQLINIGQSVLHGYLMLSAVVHVPPPSHAIRRLLFAVTELGLRLDVTPLQAAPEAPPAVPRSQLPALCITALGPLQRGVAVAEVTRFLAEHRMNICDIRTLSDEPLRGLEFIANLPEKENPATLAELSELRGKILSLAADLGVDMAVQRDDIFRRNKRLICFDVDSTFVQGEFIDELAEASGCKAEVAAITERAMRGEFDFEQSLRERVALLKGLPIERAKDVSRAIHPTPGAARIARMLKSLGYRVGLISGGFDFYVEELRQQFGLDVAFGNELEVINGKLTGRVLGTVLDASRKAQLLRDMAKVYQCRIEQTIAVGDGANDMQMLCTAGLGIAFRGKPKLQEVADMSLNFHDRIDTLLYLMGFNARELSRLDQQVEG